MCRNSGEFFLWVDLEGVTNEHVLVALCQRFNAERFEQQAGFTTVQAPEGAFEGRGECLSAEEAPRASSDEKMRKVLSATAWRDDRRALGSYSFLAPGCIPEDVDALAARVGRVPVWAGEHTSREHSRRRPALWESGRAKADAS